MAHAATVRAVPIKLRNRGRSPITIDLVSLGAVPQTLVRVNREGRQEVTRAFPRSVSLPARGVSDVLPDEVRKDPALAGRTDIEILDVQAPAAPQEK
jgi:hypothetical protein